MLPGDKIKTDESVLKIRS